MGRYILLEFDDDDQAEKFGSKIIAAHARGARFSIIGIFQKPPTKRCECLNRSTEPKNTENRRHKKTGFWYCSRCKRVRPGWQSPRNFLDDPALTPNWFSRGQAKEATLHLDNQGRPLQNYPITDRLGA
jgi:hypothetical protein